MTRGAVGTVASLHRYPVKSMLGEQLPVAELTSRGLTGDRAWALVDVETGKVVSAKRPRRWAGMLQLTATTDSGGGVRVRSADGAEHAVGDPAGIERLCEHLGRTVAWSSSPAEDATIDEVWAPELKGDVRPYFDLPTRPTDEGELMVGGQFMGPQGNFFDFGAVHLLTTSSLRQLSRQAPGSDFSPARFRPNLLLDTAQDGFMEAAWAGRTLVVGDVRLSVSFTVPRCVMTTLAQPGLAADPRVLRTVTALQAVDCFGIGTAYPCLGVYADVLEPGVVHPGDEVRLS